MINYFEKLYKGTKEDFLATVKDSLVKSERKFIVTANPEAFMLGEKMSI